VLVLHPSLSADNLQEFIALARSRPGQLNYSSAGSGGVQQLASELFNIMAGVRIQGIPYKGGGAAVTDLIGGQVQLSFQNTPAVVSHINTGKLKGIAITGEKRFPALPQVPTFTQAGLPGFDVKNWFALLARSGTPKEIVDKLSSDIARALSRPDIKERLDSLGLDPYIGSPDQLAALMRLDMAKYARVIKDANIRMDN
jgi:tripartite-type tricarboxylate transporter receptor subunit TctC